MSLMDPEPGSNSEIKTAQLGERLDSWKEIAGYLNRSVGRFIAGRRMRVSRFTAISTGSSARCSRYGELDAWLNARSPDADLPAEDRQTAAPRRPTLAVALALVTAPPS